MRKILILSLSFFIFFTTKTYANENFIFNDWKTIKELKKEIEKLDKKNNLDENIDIFFKENNIDDFFYSWLSKENIKTIKNIIVNYILKSNDLEKKLKNSNSLEEFEKNQSKFLSLKKEFYKSLIVYIDKKDYKNYLNFIEKNINNFIEKNNLYLAKFKAQLNYEKKVELLEKKIKENQQNLDNEIKNIIEQKIDEKLSAFLTSQSFLKLSKKQKSNFILKVLEKLKNKKWNLDLNEDSKKIEIYEVFIWKMLEVSSTLK